MRTIPFVCFFATACLACSSALSDDKDVVPPIITSTHGVSLAQLRDISYRIDWVNQKTSHDLRLVTISGDNLFAVDTFDHLVSYDIDTGSSLWSSPVGNHIYRLLGINTNEAAGQVYVNAVGAIFIFETATGNLPTRAAHEVEEATDKPVQKLNWSANTPGIMVGPILLYGSRNGELVWHDCSIGFSSRTYAIGTSMQTTPAVSGGIVIATAGEGSVAAVDLKSARALWLIKLLDAVVATPVISNGTVYIAGKDQYLRAIDLYTGRPRWKFLTTAELTDPPYLAGDALYQRVPGVGLISFKAAPPDITGEKRWTAKNVRGLVSTTATNGRLLCWDQENRILQEVDPAFGSITSTLELPSVRELLVDNSVQGNLYLVTDDDAIIKLIPRLKQ